MSKVIDLELFSKALSVVSDALSADGKVRLAGEQVWAHKESSVTRIRALAMTFGR
jgi:hypothetical protein